MASGYKSHGTDLDSIFEPRGGSTARANVGYKVGGTDLAQRYYASTGGDTPPSATGYKVGGVDLNTLFRRLGYPIPPVISSVSVTPSVYVGGTIYLDVTLSQGEDVSYEWYHGMVLISTSKSYSFTATSIDSGVYIIYVSNINGTDNGSGSCTVYDEPTATISGPSSVPIGGGGGGSWSWSGAADAGIDQYRVYVPGHGGAWTSGGGAGSVSGSTPWGSPFGSPDISGSGGSYSIVIEVQDMNGHTASDSVPFTVS